MTTQKYLYEQDDALKVPALLDEDPVTTKWPLPEPRPWWPSAPMTLREVFKDLMERVGL